MDHLLLSSTDGKGDLVLVSRADSQIITIQNPGAGNQSQTVPNIGTQPGDTVYPKATAAAGGRRGRNTYWVSKDTPVAAGSIYTQAPNDSGVTSFVRTVDPKTGFITHCFCGDLAPQMGRRISRPPTCAPS